MTRKELVEKMWDVSHEHNRICLPMSVIDLMLQVVLDAIEAGEVVEIINVNGCKIYGIELKSAFRRDAK